MNISIRRCGLLGLALSSALSLGGVGAAAPAARAVAPNALASNELGRWCGETGGWPPRCSLLPPPIPRFPAPENARAADGRLHYEVVRSVFTELIPMPAERRVPKIVVSLIERSMAAHGMKITLSPRTGDRSESPDAALRRIRASPALSSAVQSAAWLASQVEPIERFERDLAVLNALAAQRLAPRERDAYLLYSAVLGEGYRFYMPADQGGSGGAELLLALHGHKRPVGGAGAGGAQGFRWKEFWRKFIHYTLVDARGSFEHLDDGVWVAIGAGAFDSAVEGTLSSSP